MPGAGVSCAADLASRVSVETYDGDTPHAERNHIREHADIILSNPDMLHQSLLPQVCLLGLGRTELDVRLPA